MILLSPSTVTPSKACKFAIRRSPRNWLLLSALGAEVFDGWRQRILVCHGCRVLYVYGGKELDIDVPLEPST